MTNRIYALYANMETAVTAVNELMTQGILPGNISVITHDPDNKYARYLDIGEDDDVDAEDGTGFGALIGALTGLGVALIPGFGPVFATGPLAAALIAGIGAGTGAVTGGITSALVDFGADESQVEHYESVLREGGAIAIVDTLSETDEDLVEKVLKTHRPLEIED